MHPERRSFSKEVPMPQSVTEAGLHDRLNQCMNFMDWKAATAHMKAGDAGPPLPDGFSVRDIPYFARFSEVFDWYYKNDELFRAYMDQEHAKHKQAQSEKYPLSRLTEQSDTAIRERALARAERAFREHISALREKNVSEEAIYALLRKVLSE